LIAVSSINTAVVIEGDEIVFVADRTSAPEHHPDDEHPRSDVLTPGLVSSHVHSPKNPHREILQCGGNRVR
jgi:cytosine/adenosine deaminase-related metal-dependent hydrolase